MKQVLIYIYSRDLWEIILFIILSQGFWGYLNYKFQYKKTIYSIWKKCLVTVPIFSIGIIYYATIDKRGNVPSELILIPFHSFIEARIQPEIYRSMLMNVFLFFPLGLSLPYALPEKWNRKVLISILFAMALSIGIEFLQYHFHLGRAETDDVIFNSLGCAIGTISYLLANRKNKASV